MSGDAGDLVMTVEEYERQQQAEREALAAKREHDLRMASQQHYHARGLARIWACVVAVLLLGVLALIGFIVDRVTSENAANHRADLDAQHRQVTVWCYADPNSDRGTSTMTGTPDQVRGFCPDQRQPTANPYGYPSGGNG